MKEHKVNHKSLYKKLKRGRSKVKAVTLCLQGMFKDRLIQEGATLTKEQIKELKDIAGIKE